MKTSRSSDIVIRYLLDLIVKGDISPGGKLPSTENLARLAGTSIISAREAVQNLACIGLVEISHGRGMFLTEGMPVFEDLLTARKVIESHAVMMATGKLDSANLERLENLLSRMGKNATDGDNEAFSDADYEFHICISKLAGNRILSKTLENIKELLYYQQSIINRLRPEIIKQSLIRHREVFEAMKKGDPDSAGAIMTRHIAEVIESWRRM